MDFLNQAIAQVSELFRSMTPGARITAGLLLAVVVISFGYLFQHASAGPDAYLFGGEALPDGQLTRAEAAIAQAGLSGYVREGNRIRVPAGQQAAYLAAVADAGALPPNFNTILENALEKAGPWESSAATRERLKIAKQQTLSEIVRAMPWVDEAAVLIGEQQSRGANSLSVTNKVTASVNVRPILGEALDPRRARNIEKLVASAVGIPTENVTVINLGDGSGTAGDDGIDPELFDKSDYYRTKVTLEMQKRAGILGVLRDIPGVRVEVNAELDSVKEEKVRDVKPDPKSVISREVSSLDESTQAAADNGGRPGLEAQGPNRQPAVAAAQQGANKQKTETTETEMSVGAVETEILKHGLTPKVVWATVTIPGKYVEDIWRSKNKDSTDPPKPEDLRTLQAEVIAKVENIVEPLLRLEVFKGQDNYKHVSVGFLDSLPMPTIEPPSMASNAMAWTGRYWSTLAMMGVAMFSLLVLRSVVRGTPSAEGTTPAAGAPTLTLHTDESAKTAHAEDKDEDELERPRLRLKKGKSLKDDLVEIVREDPDAAADILRSWIGKAG
jgi:flagellar M-ring protein FliF